jgi:hypothetical protein
VDGLISDFWNRPEMFLAGKNFITVWFNFNRIYAGPDKQGLKSAKMLRGSYGV